MATWSAKTQSLLILKWIFPQNLQNNYTKQAGFTDAGMDLVDMDIVAVLNAGSKVYP